MVIMAISTSTSMSMAVFVFECMYMYMYKDMAMFMFMSCSCSCLCLCSCSKLSHWTKNFVVVSCGSECSMVGLWVNVTPRHPRPLHSPSAVYPPPPSPAPQQLIRKCSGFPRSDARLRSRRAWTLNSDQEGGGVTRPPVSGAVQNNFRGIRRIFRIISNRLWLARSSS